MTTTWVSGTGITVTLGGSTDLQVTSISNGLAPTVGSKTVLGQEYAGKVATQGDGSWSGSGEVTQENLAGLAAFRTVASQPVAVVVTYWATGDTEAFDLYISDLTTDADGSGEATWSISGDIDGGTYVHTPAV